MRQWGNTFPELFSPADLEKNAFLEGYAGKMESIEVFQTRQSYSLMPFQSG